MDIVNEILSNRILITGAIAWVSAQVIKTIIFMIMNRACDLTRLFGDGGMPSSHSATVTSVALSVGLDMGFDTPIFALAFFVAVIVMHDAMGVRRETGKQAKILNDMIELLYDEETSPEEKLKEFVGHSPSQVCAGFALGVIIALLMKFVIMPG